MLRTLADLKRTIHVGQKWHTYHHLMKKDMGVRRIQRLQSNAAIFETERGGSYLYYPKAKDYKAHEDGRGFDVYDNRELVLTYRIIDGSSEVPL